MVDWTPVLVALTAGLPATIAATGAIILSWRNLRKQESNAVVATANARAAATAASDAKAASEGLSRQFNGALDERITRIVKQHVEPLAKAIERLAAKG